MRTLVYFLVLFLLPALAFAVPLDTLAIEEKIASAFGNIERNESGIIIGIDLARDRASANDDVLKAALTIPNLKRFRFAGGNVSAESLNGLTRQQSLEELYLQDVPIRDAEWHPLLDGHSTLTRLTLRRLPNLSSNELGSLPQRLPALRNLAFIEMELSGEALAEIAKSERLTALDIRHCSRLAAIDYRCLVAMSKLSDLKIGGFGITDEVLAEITPLRFLRGLTIDDALITPRGLEEFTEKFASANKLDLLVFSRNSALFDDALVSLKKFPNLKRLTINGMMVTGTFLESLADDEATRPKIQRLSLRKAFLTEGGTAALKKYPELRILDISGTTLTPELIGVVASLRGLSEIDVTDCGLDDDMLLRLKSIPILKR